MPLKMGIMKILLLILFGVTFCIILIHFSGTNVDKLKTVLQDSNNYLWEVLKTNSTDIQIDPVQPRKRHNSSEICPEKYRGLYYEDYPYRYETWTRENCSFEKDLGDLVTVVVNHKGADDLKGLVHSLKKSYPTVKLVAGVNDILDKSTEMEGVEIVKTGAGNNTWTQLLKLCKTKYVLVGFDLDYISSWINLHRGIRLLGQGSLAVAGALRNQSGHWSIPCYQVAMRYYRLEMKEGYNRDIEDCMQCNYAGGPLLVAKENLKELRGDLPENMMMLDWSLRTKGEWLACPDIMYHTKNINGKEAQGAKREEFQVLAKTWGFQGVVTEWRPRMKEQFTCKEVGLSCDSWGQAATIRLQTWCCHESYSHVMNLVEKLAVDEGLEYEIGDGGLLGGVKLGNFMPWDIDIDLDYDKKQINKYKPGGAFEVPLKKAGINVKVSKYNKAHVVYLRYQGIKTEMWANKYENMSRTFTEDHLKHSPTRIQIGKNTWLRTYANPGLSMRGRYGPRYLQHSESWILRGMKKSQVQYMPGEWKKCKKPGHHACLSNYPTVGNMDLTPDIYP